MAKFNVNMRRWNGSSFDNVLPLAFNSEALGGKSYDDIINAVKQTIGTGGFNCRISSGSYAGNGKTGQSSPSSLTFDFTPVLVVIIRKNSPGTHTLFMRPNGYGPMGDTMGTITWGEKKVSWYCQNPQVAGDVQMNMSGSDYYYVGLGY